MAIVAVKIIEGPTQAREWKLETKINKFLETLENGTGQLIDIKITPGHLNQDDYVLPTATIIYGRVPFK
jgi:hypothetical protein